MRGGIHMEIKIIQEPRYQLTLSVEEISALWNVLSEARFKGIENVWDLFNKLEDIRPAGGFREGK
jgi:aspartate aminotransferase-like enzyme